MRMIDADALIGELHNTIFEDGEDRAIVYRVIQGRPTISAQTERKKGKWIEVNDSYNRISGRCSMCGWESHMYEDDVVGMDFCPNCGADMRGEQDG